MDKKAGDLVASEADLPNHWQVLSAEERIEAAGAARDIELVAEEDIEEECQNAEE